MTAMTARVRASPWRGPCLRAPGRVAPCSPRSRPGCSMCVEKVPHSQLHPPWRLSRRRVFVRTLWWASGSQGQPGAGSCLPPRGSRNPRPGSRDVRPAGSCLQSSCDPRPAGYRETRPAGCCLPDPAGPRCPCSARAQSTSASQRSLPRCEWCPWTRALHGTSGTHGDAPS
jgi:hypothetical protein